MESFFARSMAAASPGELTFPFAFLDSIAIKAACFENTLLFCASDTSFFLFIFDHLL
jgi:hypothetical protein